MVNLLPMKFLYLIIFTVLIIFPACQRDQIEVVRIPKQLSQDKTSALNSENPAAAPVRWKAPSQWIAQPRSEMRAGSFLIKGDNGQTAEVSIVPLAGEAGGNLANINRWRQQIELTPLSEAELKKNASLISVGQREMIYVNFVSEKPLINNQFKKRVIATIYVKAGTSWFFKLMGDDKTVQRAERDFIQFLKTVEFAAHE